MENVTEVILVGKEPPPLSETNSIMGMIRDAQADPNVDITKMERLFDLYERAKGREAQEAYNHAVSKVTDKMPRIVKNKKVLYDIKKGEPDKGKEEAFSFAALEDIDKIVKPLLHREKLRVSYTTKTKEGGGAVIVCRLTHVLGHYEESEIPLALDTSGGKNNVQAMGSTFSYGKRYTLCGVLDLVIYGEDDDAQSLTAIDEKEVEIIKSSLTDVGADEAKFLEFMGVEKVEDISKKDLAKATNMITAKRKAKEKKEGKK